MASSSAPQGEENEGVGYPRAAVFITTSLSTRMALNVHLHDTVADLKRNIVVEHSTLFPGYKEIRIDAVKLNRRDMSYSLSDSMLLRTILDGMKGNMFLCVDASVCGEEHLKDQGLMSHAGGLNIEEDNEEAAVIGASSLGTIETDHKETSTKELPLIVPEIAVVDDAGQVNGVQQNGCPELGDNNREFIRDESIPKTVGAVVCEPSAAASVVADKSSAKKRKKPPPKRESSRKQEPKEKKYVLDQVVGSKVASTLAEPKIPNETADPGMRPLKGDPKEKFEPELPLIVPELAVVDDAGQVNGVQQNGCPELGDNNREFIRDESIPKAVGAVVCEQSAAASVVADKSSAKKRKKPPPKSESSRKQEPKEKKHVLDQVVGSKVASTPAEPKIPNETADPGMRPLKEDPKEKFEPELPLIVPEIAVVDDAGQVNGVQQNGCPELGDNNREFIRDESIPKAVGAVVCEPSAAASVVDDKSSAKKRKKPPPKSESSRKQEPKEKKHVLDQVVGSRVASTMAEPKIPNETADPGMLPLKGDPKEKFEPKHLVVIGLKWDSCLDKSKEAVDGDRTEVHSQGALSEKRKGKEPKSLEQVGDASASTKKTLEKTRKSTNASAVPNPSAVPNSDKEGETQGAADILEEKGDVAGTNKNAEPILNTAGSSKDMIVSAFNMEMEMETVRSGKEIMKSSSRKEGRKEMTKKRRLTSDRHSVAVQNSSKLSAKQGELSEPNAARNNITSSPVLISSPSENDEEAMKIQTRSSRRAAATKMASRFSFFRTAGPMFNRIG